MFLCQQVSLEEVFDKSPCPLSQPVLLSLIQQLSVDFNNHLKLKIKYDAIVDLLVCVCVGRGGGGGDGRREGSVKVPEQLKAVAILALRIGKADMEHMHGCPH